MATHRYRSVVTVAVTSAALVLASVAPAEAATRRPGTTTLSASEGTTHERTVARRLTTRTAKASTATRLRRVKPVATPTAGPTASPAPLVATPTDPGPVTTTTTEPTAGPLPALPQADPVTALAGSPSGQAAPRGDLPGWRQTYVEDFTRDVPTGSFPGAYADHWYAYADGVKDTSRNGTYMPSKVLSVHDGVLDYHIRTENGQHLVSAPCLKDTYHQTYGRYSVRFRADSLPGYKNAWLLWPDSQRWPDDGEIDFPEGHLDGSIEAFAHHASPSGTQDVFSSGESFRAWHTATIEWLPGKVSFLLDGRLLGSSTRDVPATAMHWVLQTETALSGGAPSAGVSGHVLVDWVTLYERA